MMSRLFAQTMSKIVLINMATILIRLQLLDAWISGLSKIGQSYASVCQQKKKCLLHFLLLLIHLNKAIYFYIHRIGWSSDQLRLFC